MNSGYIFLHRELLHHPIWTKAKFTDGQAWVDLLLLANYHDGKVRRGGAWVPVRRGQVFTSQLALAKRWAWNRKTVRGFLDALELDSMLDIETSKQTDTGYTLLTLKNYERYQTNGTREPDIQEDTHADIEGDTRRTSDGHSLPTSKKLRREEQVRRSLSSTHWPGFDDFWAAYPRKTAKAAALKVWSALRPAEALRAELLRALDEQRRWPEWIRDGGQYIPYPDKWLRGRRWEDRSPELAGRSEPSARDQLSELKEWTS